jgi:FkbM family methyltransferase
MEVSGRYRDNVFYRMISKLSYALRAVWYEESNQGQRWRRLSLFFGWQVWKRLIAKPITIQLFNGLRFTAYPDCDISAGALYMRIPDGEDIMFLRQHLCGGTFIDVGANVGLVTMLIADRVQHAILFEPNPAAIIRAKQNLSLNCLHFPIYPLALSDNVGSVEFENSGGVSPCNRTVVGFKTSAPTIMVRRVTFDSFLKDVVDEDSLIEPFTIKIDVEGHENEVLRGMKNFLIERRPKLIMFEYLQRMDISYTLRFFDEIGYSVCELVNGGLIPAASVVAPLQNLFARPTELIS